MHFPVKTINKHMATDNSVRLIVDARTISCNLVSVFYTSKNRVVKIMCSSYEAVLQTENHTMIYPGSGPSLR
jgi:hypothetical protein